MKRDDVIFGIETKTVDMGDGTYRTTIKHYGSFVAEEIDWDLAYKAQRKLEQIERDRIRRAMPMPFGRRVKNFLLTCVGLPGRWPDGTYKYY